MVALECTDDGMPLIVPTTTEAVTALMDAVPNRWSVPTTVVDVPTVRTTTERAPLTPLAPMAVVLVTIARDWLYAVTLVETDTRVAPALLERPVAVVCVRSGTWTLERRLEAPAAVKRPDAVTLAMPARPPRPVPVTAVE